MATSVSALADPNEPVDGIYVNGELLLYGVVGGPDGFYEGFTPAQVARALAAHGDGDVKVRINSPGGNAFDGMAIYSLLRTHAASSAARVTVSIDGIAASGASLIAMAGDRIEMRAGTLMMIHDASAITIGTADDHGKSRDMLNKLSEQYARVYAERSGKSRASVRKMMLDETWFTPEEAITAGFATAVLSERSMPVAAFDYRVYAKAPSMLTRPVRKVPSQKPSSITPPSGDHISMDTDIEETGDPALAKLSPQVASERSRIQAITRTAATLSLPQSAVDAAIEAGTTASAFAALAIDQAAAAQAAVMPAPNGGRLAQSIYVSRDAGDVRMKAMTGELVRRITGRDEPTSDASRAYRGMGFVEMAAECVGHRGRIPNTTAAAERLLATALHSTSDFPRLVEASFDQVLAQRYQLAKPTYRMLAQRRDVADFRPVPYYKAGDIPALLPLGEGGEIKHGTFGEESELLTAVAYARTFTLSRQLLVNDQFGAIDSVIGSYASRINSMEERLFWTLVASNAGAGPTLRTTTRGVFNTTDGSRAATGATPTVATVGAGRAAMRKQRGVDGLFLQSGPAMIVAGPDREPEVDQLVVALTPNQTSQVNPFSGTLEKVVTPEISGNGWYLFADPSAVPCFIWSLLEGYTAPRLTTKEMWETQSLGVKVEHDFGVSGVDWRGGWFNPGA